MFRSIPLHSNDRIPSSLLRHELEGQGTTFYTPLHVPSRMNANLRLRTANCAAGGETIGSKTIQFHGASDVGHDGREWVVLGPSPEMPIRKSDDWLGACFWHP
jgi:hypothetical protein